MDRKSHLARVIATLLATALLLLARIDGAMAAEEIRIGVLTDFADASSGLVSAIAAEVAVEEMGGKVLGRPVKIIALDHQADPQIGLARAQELIEKHRVRMITNLARSNVAIAVQQYAVGKKVIVMPTGAAASALHGEFCSPYAFHWGFDSYALVNSTVEAVTRRGGDSWYFVTADYAFGRAVETQSAALATAAGARTLGSSRYPFQARNVTTNLKEAMDSGARVIALASGGIDTQLAIRQAYELGLVDESRQLATMLMFISDVRRLGLYVASGLQFTTPYYWDYDERSRALGEKVFARSGVMPTMSQAGTYSAVLNYLKAIETAGTVEPEAVAAALERTPVDDAFARNGRVRPDGLMVHDMFLVQVKAPIESQRAWDYYNVLERIDGDKAYAPLEQSGCKNR